MGNYKDAWTDVKGLIDAHYPYPQHQGKTDITEVVEFAHISADWDLTQKQEDRLIDQAQRYHDEKDKKFKRGDLSDWIKNTTDAVKNDYSPHSVLIDLFKEFGWLDEFDRYWQWGYFDEWTNHPTEKGLRELFQLVQAEGLKASITTGSPRRKESRRPVKRQRSGQPILRGLRR